MVAALAATACGPARSPSGPVMLPEYPPPVHAASASKEAALQVAAPAPDAAPLTGTTWSGTDSDGALDTYEFRSGGALHYTSPTGTFDNATWKQDGHRVTWEMNGHYADYEGTIEGSRIEGKAHNKVGHKWTFSLKKQAPP
jgi:hypothetical protein